MRRTLLLIMLFLLVSATSVFAFESAEHGSLGASLPIWSVIPFIGILLSIAVFPLVAPEFWHHHFGKIAGTWALILAVPFTVIFKGTGIHEIIHILLLEFIPFIILLWSLFTISGGIFMEGAPVGIPRNNLILLVIGTALASWIGTTGAAMVMIRPYIRMNSYRKSKVHLIVFFIFLVANIGGSLTPLGDPPLFLGFLQGVDFFWTFHLFPAMLMVSLMLFLIFFIWDTYMFRKEGWHKKMHLLEEDLDLGHPGPGELEIDEKVEVVDVGTQKFEEKTYTIKLHGMFNVLFLLGVIGGVLFSGSVHLGEAVIFGIHVPVENLIRDIFLVCMGLLSLKFTPKQYREGNGFNWFPIVEVAKLFAGIFITIIPAISMLRAGSEGHLKFIIDAVEKPSHYFWITGTLSSFLDNAPTYLVFFNTALGKFGETVTWLMADGGIFLLAISCGAVFFGANTYIGNAPNFMVKSIAEESKIPMPSFFGYMLYSIVILVPLFIIVTWVFF